MVTRTRTITTVFVSVTPSMTWDDIDSQVKKIVDEGSGEVHFPYSVLQWRAYDTPWDGWLRDLEASSLSDSKKEYMKQGDTIHNPSIGLECLAVLDGPFIDSENG